MLNKGCLRQSGQVKSVEQNGMGGEIVEKRKKGLIRGNFADYRGQGTWRLGARAEKKSRTKGGKREGRLKAHLVKREKRGTNKIIASGP